MNESNPAVVCLSGGMDSTSLLLHLLAQERDVYGISFDYGQKHKLELKRLRSNLEYIESSGYNVKWHLIDISSISCLLHSALVNENWDVPTGHYESENMKETVVPNRNAIFSSVAFAHALSLSQKLETEIKICLGVHSGDHSIYPDCRPEFYNAIFNAFHLGNWDSDVVSMYLPYLKFDKLQILKDAQRSLSQLNLDFNRVFANTLTSYAPDENGQSDGLTGSDVERILAFDQLGIPDPIEYHSDWPSVVASAKRLAAKFQSEN